jgi:thiol-disulfide isomerase/thioredoxin
MDNSSTSSCSYGLVKKTDESSKIVIYGIILLIIIIILYYIFYSLNNRQNKDTIVFYVANWCQYCKKFKKFINDCKKQKKVNIVVVNDYEMNKKEKKLINVFPTAILYSGNKTVIAEGELKIKKLVNKTLLLSNIEFFDAKEDIIFYLDNSSDISSNLIISNINNNNNQTSYNLIIKYKNNIQDTDTDFSGNKINSFPTAVIQSNKETYNGYFDVLSLLEKVLNIKIFEAITFYVADWCRHCNDLKPYINKLKDKQQTEVQINIVNFNNMNIEEKTLINGFPAVMRKSDNIVGFGKYDIEKIVKETILIDLIEEFATNNDKIIVCLAKWCGYCNEFKPELTEIMKTNSNIELLDSEDITPELQEYVKGYPTALKISDKKVVQVAVGSSEIKKMINSA